jgi:hypothetical protein
MAKDGQPTRFPRFRVWWRIYNATENVLASLPVVLLLPTLAALVGAAYAASHPSSPRGTSFSSALVGALVSGAGTLIAVALLIFFWLLAWYRLRGDRVWKVAWSFKANERFPGVHSRVDGLNLICDMAPPSSVATLGDVEAVLRSPRGEYRRMPNRGMGGGSHVLGFSPGGLIGWEGGVYEVRWYGTTSRRRRYEIARSKYMLEPPDWANSGLIPRQAA